MVWLDQMDWVYPAGHTLRVCHENCIAFVVNNLTAADVHDRRLLEVGSRDVNGSVGPHLKDLGPTTYVGVDIESGPGVDIVCDATELVSRFGPDSFDVVVSTELMEHVVDWRVVISNMKNVVKPSGLLVVTTRSKGFVFHGYPYDFWRYEEEDFKRMFSDFTIECLEQDEKETPGIFIRARKPQGFVEADLSDLRLYSILHNKRVLDVSRTRVVAIRGATQVFEFIRRVVPQSYRRPVQDLIRRHTRLGPGS